MCLRFRGGEFFEDDGGCSESVLLHTVPLLVMLGGSTRGWGHGCFFLASPFMILVIAAATFALVYTVLPSFRRRARYTGAIAGVVSFLVYESYTPAF